MRCPQCGMKECCGADMAPEIEAHEATIAALRAQLGDATDLRDSLYGDIAAEKARADLAESRLARMREAARDALSGWVYIRGTHGDLYGVGWDRVQEKLEAALAEQEVKI